ncbi:MAG: hypothetical protein Q8N05_16605 [Bacteroidota bacterium]|nr:hypothetical protein [Bacteroidota bacterium]
MKKLLIVFILSGIFGAAMAQNGKIEKGATKVVIETGKSKEENFKLCKKILTESEIMIESNNENYTIKTDELNTKKKNYIYYLTFFCKDNSIVVSGKSKSGISIELYGVKSEDNFETIVNRGSPGSFYGITFTEMVTMAQKFGYELRFE